jgi:PPOX class probable F420-dependent enzyme
VTDAETGSRAAIYRATAHELTDSMREFLSRQLYTTLATQNSDGSMHVVPILYRFDGQRFLMATSATTRKARNIAARPTVTVTVDDRTELRWVSAQGTAQLLHGQTAYELNQSLYRLWMTDEGLKVVGAFMANIEDVTIEVIPLEWRAWDIESTFYRALADAGIPLDQPDRFFLA